MIIERKEKRRQEKVGRQGEKKIKF